MSIPEYFTDVNYDHAQVIIRAMKDAGRETLGPLHERGIKTYPTAHCTSIQYPFSNRVIGTRIEFVGHLPVLAEIVARALNNGKTFFREVGVAAVYVSAQDIIVHGHHPDVFEDGLGFHLYSWGKENPGRLLDFARGMRDGCKKIRAEFRGGESAAGRYLINPPPDSIFPEAPVIFSNTIGSTAPEELVVGDEVQAGDVILGALSTGPHVNAISAIMRLPGFPAILRIKLADGQTFGEAVMAEMGCYFELTSALQFAGIKPTAQIAGSGGGVSKAAFGDQNLTYEISHWPEPLPAFRKIMELMKLEPDLKRPAYAFLKEFNAGIGWLVFVRPEDERASIRISKETSTPLMKLGDVKEGKRGTKFEPDSDTWREFVPPEQRWLDPQEF